MMFAKRVSDSDLIDQLVAESYDPALMKYCNRTSGSPLLGEFLLEKPRLGVTGTIADSYVVPSTLGAVPYMTTKQVSGLFAYVDDDCRFITAAADELWSHCRVPDGAIIINKSGNVGAASIVACAPHQYVSTVSDLINIRPRVTGTSAASGRAIDAGYLVVFLNSPFGQSQLQRLSGGAVFDHVSLFAIPKVRVVEPHPLAQAYIGDKVRQSERLRERARALECEANDFIRTFRPSRIVESHQERPRRVPPQFVSADSLNPDYARAVEGHLEFPNGLQVSNLIVPDGCKCGEPIRADERVEGEYLYYGASGPIDRHNDFNFEGEYLIVAQDGTIGCACVARGRFWANNHVWVLKIREEYDPDAIAGFLNDHYPYWDGLTTGSVVPKVTSENLLKAVVPAGVATSKESGQQLREASCNRQLAASLTTAAKLLVEALIEGKVTEDELKDAHGNRDADRAILQRLTRSGIDVPNEPPLFPNLDDLYAAFDESADASVTVEACG